ncbi:hypothetical protein L543_3195 [Bordetella hinzii L60]|nr:hypothetical protein L543_3195 [Bordetella hinzii L60]
MPARGGQHLGEGGRHRLIVIGAPAQFRAEVARADEQHIHPVHAGQRLGLGQARGALDHDGDEQRAVQGRAGFAGRESAIVQQRLAGAHRTPSPRRIAGRGHGLAGGGGILQVRQDQAHGAAIEHAADQRGIDSRQAHQRHHAGLARRVTDPRRGFQRQDAVLQVHIQRIEPGAGRDTADFVAAHDAHAHGDRHAAGGQERLERIAGQAVQVLRHAGLIDKWGRTGPGSGS